MSDLKPNDLPNPARRRALLKGAGKGAAVAAVAGAPVIASAKVWTGSKSLLTRTTEKGKPIACSMSGWQSVTATGGIARSVDPRRLAGTDPDDPRCDGFNTTYWYNPTNWSSRGIPDDVKNTKFNAILPGVSTAGLTDSSNQPLSVFSVLTTSNRTANAGILQWLGHWMTAKAVDLNKVTTGPVKNFPFTAAEVSAAYASPAAMSTLTFMNTHLRGVS